MLIQANADWGRNPGKVGPFLCYKIPSAYNSQPVIPLRTSLLSTRSSRKNCISTAQHYELFNSINPSALTDLNIAEAEAEGA